MTIDRSAIITTLQRPGTEAGPTGLNSDRSTPTGSTRTLAEHWPADGRRGAAKPSWPPAAGRSRTARSSRTARATGRPSCSTTTGVGQLRRHPRSTAGADTLGLEVKPAGQPTRGLLRRMKLGDFDITAASTGGAGVLRRLQLPGQRLRVPVGEKATLEPGPLVRPRDRRDHHGDGEHRRRGRAEGRWASGCRRSWWTRCRSARSTTTTTSSRSTRRRWTGWPTPDNFDHIPFVGMGPDPILTLLASSRRRAEHDDDGGTRRQPGAPGRQRAGGRRSARGAPRRSLIRRWGFLLRRLGFYLPRRRPRR